jgi:hypothetical protein
MQFALLQSVRSPASEDGRKVTISAASFEADSPGTLQGRRKKAKGQWRYVEDQTQTQRKTTRLTNNARLLACERSAVSAPDFVQSIPPSTRQPQQ